MATNFRNLFDDNRSSFKSRLMSIYAGLTVLNVGGWLWAVAAFHDKPAALGISALVFGLGMRHAVDADHIAAIDNVTRKLMQMRQRPVAVGFYFALGHSTVVVVVAGAVAMTATALSRLKALQDVGSILGTAVSALFLLAIAVMNVAIFVSIYRSFRRVRAGGPYVEADLDILLNHRGLLSRLLRPLFRLVTRSWHMFPLGVLFGLGFDTATEVTMFGVSAAEASKGLSFGAIMIFPVLFAAGMSLVDTTDGVMMVGAYEWAFVTPLRKLYYNMTITLVSILVAVLIGGIEALSLISAEFRLQGRFWDQIGMANENVNTLGFAIIGIFVTAWLLSYVLYRTAKLDELNVAHEDGA